jgi:DNA primase
MSIAAGWYEEQLQKHPQRQFAIDELARRGLDPSHEAVRAFRIGYAPSGWDGLASFLKKQGISPAVAESLGLVAPRSSGSGYYDRFRHRLMFSVIDARGRVVAFSGRVLAPLPGDEERPPPVDGGQYNKPPKYINSPETPIYVKGTNLFGLWQARNSVRQQEHAILVEGNFDVVSLHARGVDNVVGPLGTAFTLEQARLLRRSTVDLTLLFDGDAAGRKAARAAAQPCEEVGLDARVAILPDKTDPDDFVRTRGESALKHLLGQARGILEYLIDAELDESFNAADSLEKSARVELVLGLIAKQRDPMRRELLESYADQVAGRLDLVRSAPNALATLKRRFVGARNARVVAGPRPSEARVKPPSRLGSEERRAIVEAILDFPTLLDDSETQEVLPLLEGESARIVAAMTRCLRTNERGEKVLDSAEFLAQMPEPIHSFASARLAAPSHETIVEARETLTSANKRLREINVAREASELAREQQKVAGDWESEVVLLQQAKELVSKRLKGT